LLGSAVQEIKRLALALKSAALSPMVRDGKSSLYLRACEQVEIILDTDMFVHNEIVVKLRKTINQ